MKKRRKGIIPIVLGSVMVICALVLSGYNYVQDYRQGKASAEVLEKMDVMIPEEPAEEAIGELYPQYEMPAVEIDGYRYIGKVVFHDLDMTLPVMEELDLDRLEISPCRYYGSLYTNDLIIGGHSSWEHFKKAKSLNVDSRIDFIDVDGHVYEYVLDSKEILDESEVDALIAEGPWDMSIFTCTVYNTSRCVLRCSRLDREEN